MAKATSCPLLKGLDVGGGSSLEPGESAYVGSIVHLPARASSELKSWDLVTQFKLCVWLIASEYPSERVHERECVDVSDLLEDLVDSGLDGPGALIPTKTTKPSGSDSPIPTIAPYTPPSITLEPLK